ncbi:MAG: APC family permease [Halobacteriaceae archaeon]
MSDSGQRAPDRDLGLIDAVMVGMGAMIGAGIFVLTGLAADIAGSNAIFVFILNGIVTGFTALSYGELVAAIPESGGGYAFVKEVFSDLISFIMGWMLWFAYIIAGAVYAIGFGSNFLEFFEIYGIHLPKVIRVFGISFPGGSVFLGLLIVVIFVSLNALSTSASGGAETIVTLIKIGVLLLFAGFGSFAVTIDRFTPFFATHPVTSLLPAMGLTFVAFEGYDLITTVTEEIRNPTENVPKAIFYSLVGTVIIYILVVFVGIGTIGAATLAKAGETAIARAAQSFMPTIPIIGSGAAIIAFGAVFSTMSALNAVILASSRVAFAMGREDQLPGNVGQVHAKYGTPFRAVIVSAIIMLIAVALIPIRQVSNLASLFFLLSFIVVNIAVIKLRRERPDIERPFTIPYYPLPPILGIVCNIILSVVINPFIWFIGIGWLGLGALVYLLLNLSLEINE